jgi:hypothetical protein
VKLTTDDARHHRRQHRQAAKRSCALSINVKHKVDLHLPHLARCLNVIRFGEAANMPRFYFHLSAPDQDFPDNIGSDVSDLTTAHSIAVRLMKRVMMFSSFADCAPDLRRWTVKVTDEKRQPVFTVLFPIYFVPRGWKPVLVSGARALLRRLDAINAVDDMSRVHVPAPPRGASEARVRTPVKRAKAGGGPLGGRPQ